MSEDTEQTSENCALLESCPRLPQPGLTCGNCDSWTPRKDTVQPLPMADLINKVSNMIRSDANHKGAGLLAEEIVALVSENIAERLQVINDDDPEVIPSLIDALITELRNVRDK